MSQTAGPRVERRARPAGVAVLASDEEALAAAAAYAAAIRPEAVARDRDGRLPFEELEDLARTGLLAVRVPRSHGGAEVSSATLTEIVRRIAVADPAWVIRSPLTRPEPTTFAAFGQIIHAAVDAGIARGALQDGATFLRERARPWSEAGVDRAAEDPHIVRLAGELETQVRAAEALLAAAGAALDTADAAAGDAAAVTEARLSVAAAKAFAGEVALRVATELFDFSGAGAADSAHGLDRHWRNARTHTLHDPARAKHLHLGRWAIDGVGPAPGHVLI